MHLFLYGPPGTGKSTIGKIVARNLGLPFVDLDRVIETNAGASIPQIMETQGEPAFRELESATLKNLLNERESVFALGGGALLRDENRVLVERNGKAILLTAQVETLIERLTGDEEKRPLLAGNLESKLASLIEKRKEHYDSFSLKLSVNGKSREQIAERAQALFGRHRLSAMGEYDVIVDSIERLGRSLYQNPIIVTDQNVANFHIERIKQVIGHDILPVVIPAGEENKNLETVSRLWNSFLENGHDRKSTVIALGGGMVCDIAGFAASTYMRGIDWVALPTTLLAMADASLGGKTGFDLPEGKNLIGSFHTPKLVLADPSLLHTLNARELRSGMAEVVKHGIIADAELFALCANGLDWVKQNLEEIVKRAMAVKIRIIEEDPYEKGIRATLNLGHTVGHAVELVSGFNLRHGEAVAIGLMVEARYSERMGIAKHDVADEIRNGLSALGLPVEIPKSLPRDEIIRAMKMDKKKNAKSIRFALPVEIGRVQLVDVEDFESVIDDGR